MKTIKLGAVALVIWGLALIGLTNQSRSVAGAENQKAPAAANDKLVWLDNYEAAVKEAKATGKPIFLEFRCAP